MARISSRTGFLFFLECGFDLVFIGTRSQTLPRFGEQFLFSVHPILRGIHDIPGWSKWNEQIREKPQGIGCNKD